MLKLNNYVKGVFGSAATVERKDGVRYKFIISNEGKMSTIIVLDKEFVIRNATLEECADLAQMVIQTPGLLDKLTKEVTA